MYFYYFLKRMSPDTYLYLLFTSTSNGNTQKTGDKLCITSRQRGTGNSKGIGRVGV